MLLLTKQKSSGKSLKVYFGLGKISVQRPNSSMPVKKRKSEWQEKVVTIIRNGCKDWNVNVCTRQSNTHAFILRIKMRSKIFQTFIFCGSHGACLSWFLVPQKCPHSFFPRLIWIVFHFGLIYVYIKSIRFIWYVMHANVSVSVLFIHLFIFLFQFSVRDTTVICWCWRLSQADS